MAIKLSQVSVTPVELTVLQASFSQIKERLQPQINHLYEMEENGETTLVTHTIWKNKVPIEVWYSNANQKKNIRSGNDTDVQMAYHPVCAPRWYPTAMMYENSRINVGNHQTVADLFTPRALVGLSLIREEIRNITDDRIRRIFEITLTGTLSQASSLVFVIRGRKQKERISAKAEVGSWVIGYWIPEEHFEINVWNCFENRFKRILRGESEIHSLFANKNDTYFDENVKLINCSATALPLADESVDYVFIDPPHANRVLYMEQSFMWNAWLGLESQINWDQEIIVTEAKARKEKDTKNYYTLLSTAFSEISRVLKQGKYFSMAFNCLDDQTWIEILNRILALGFEIKEIVPLKYSATSVIQDNRKNALKTDFVLTFQNTSVPSTKRISFSINERELRNEITNMLTTHPKYQVYNVINALFTKTIPIGYIYKVSHIVKICRELQK